MENKVILYGASGHCKVIIDILQKTATPIDCIVDDNPNPNPLLGYTVLHSNDVNLDSLSNLILSIGNNQVRKLLSEKLKINFAKAIHPTAIISNSATIDEGTVVMAGVIINPEAKIGKHCIVNSAAVVEHDCVISDFAHISPNVSLAGGVVVGEGTHVGIGAVVIQGIQIGKWVTIGAGTVVINDLPDFAVVVGNPGKIIKYKKEDE